MSEPEEEGLIWKANAGPQERFLACSAFEALYGGQAGGGKSEALLMAALRHIPKPDYRALLLRRTFPELKRSLIDRSMKWYPIVGGEFTGSPTPMWRFPSGAVIEFGHLQYEHDVHAYMSAEYQFIGFDELSLFTESQYTYMLSRLRSASGIPSRVRSGTNPPPDLTGAWVLRRWAPWLDFGPDYHGVRAASGETLYFVNSRKDGEKYVDQDTLDEEGNPAMARVFFRARIADNPHLEENDPGYRSRLLGLDAVSRAQLLDGDWSRIDTPGALWQRDWINTKRVTSHPRLDRIGIGLDPSGSHRKGSDEAGIIVAGVGPCSCRGERQDHGFVIHDASGVMHPQEQVKTAVELYHRYKANFVVCEQNFGGGWLEVAFRDADPTVNLVLEASTRSKTVRAEPVAALYDTSRLAGGVVHHVGTPSGLENEMCFAAGTRVITARGNIAIEHVRVGDLALTRQGWRRVSWAGQTGVMPVGEIRTASGSVLRCTSSHPVYVEGQGFVSASDINVGEGIVACDPSLVSAWSSKRKDIFSRTTVTSNRVAVQDASRSFFIAPSGSMPTGQFLADGTFITGTTIGAITPSRTSSRSAQQSTSENMDRRVLPSSRTRFAVSDEGASGLRGGLTTCAAVGVGLRFKHVHIEPFFALGSVSAPGSEPVYDLTVDDAHEFFAEGVLVHNCTFNPIRSSLSPGRMDALVFVLTKLMLEQGGSMEGVVSEGERTWTRKRGMMV